MAWDQNDWKAAALIIFLMGIGLVLGLYGLGFLDEIWEIEMNWFPPGAG